MRVYGVGVGLYEQTLGWLVLRISWYIPGGARCLSDWPLIGTSRSSQREEIHPRRGIWVLIWFGENLETICRTIDFMISSQEERWWSSDDDEESLISVYISLEACIQYVRSVRPSWDPTAKDAKMLPMLERRREQSLWNSLGDIFGSRTVRHRTASCLSWDAPWRQMSTR